MPIWYHWTTCTTFLQACIKEFDNQMKTMAGCGESSADELIKQRLKLCQVSSKGMITGYLDSRQAYDDLIRDLKVLGCCFSVRSCYIGKDEKGTLQYTTMSSDLQIPFTGSPFHIEGTTYYVCTQGARYYKRKTPAEENIEEEDSDEGPKKKRRKVSRDIKMGCPAKMTVKCIRVFPDYKTTLESWRRKSDVLKRLKADLELSPPPRYEVHYWVAVSPECSHNHKRTATQKIQALHPDLISEIHRLANSGLTLVPEIKVKLADFVEKMFLNSKLKPDRSNSAFYPNDKSIYNHVHEARTSVGKQPTARKKGILKQHAEKENPSSGGDSTVAVVPRHEENNIQKAADPDMAVVPVLSSSFNGEWHDQTVLQTNFVPVLSNSGTLMLMVAQPVGEHMGHVEGSTIDSSTNIVNVNFEDNLYAVSIDDQGNRVLTLCENPGIPMSQVCGNEAEVRMPLVLEGNGGPNLSPSHKSTEVDMNCVITMEGSLVMDLKSSVTSENNAKSALSCSESQITYMYQEQEPQPHQEETSVSQPQDISRPSLLVNMSQPESNTSVYENAKPCVCSDEGDSFKADALELQELQGKKEDAESLALDARCVSSQQEERLLPTRIALRDCAQDIINMSYGCSNKRLLRKLVSALDKCRLRLRSEIEKKRNPSIKDFSPVKSSSNSSAVVANDSIKVEKDFEKELSNESPRRSSCL